MRGWPESALTRTAGQIPCILTGSRATGRIAAFLQGGKPRGGIIPCNNEGILFGDSTTEGKNEDGSFSHFWGVPQGPPRPPKEVLKIRGEHQSSRELESLHFNGVP